jgi:hypothetical protein
VQSGDDHDFAGFYAGVFPRLVGQFFLITRNLQDAEDVVQEAMARASARWARVRDYDVPEAWVRRVAVRLAADLARRGRRRLAATARLAATVPEPPAGVSSGPAAGFPPVRVGRHTRLVGEPWSAVRLTEGGLHYRLVVYRVQGRSEPRQQHLCLAFQAAAMPPSSSQSLCTIGKAGAADPPGFQLRF